MCIGLWSLDHPDYALILCTNRDEYLSRPTVNAHFHSFGRVPESPFVLSGRDLQAGGSWLGVNRVGKVALLTNISEQDSSHKISRGFLVSSFLLPDAPSLDQYIHEATHEVSRSPTSEPEYAGFNLLLLSPSGRAGTETDPLTYEASLVTNHGGGGVMTMRRLCAEERRVGGVSNGIDGVDGNDWPKVRKGVARLKEILFDEGTPNALSEDELTDQLFDLLSWQPASHPANRSQLRTSIHIPPIRMTTSLSPDASADGPELYGTRLSTVLLVRRDGRVTFIEKDIWKLNTEEVAVQGDPKDARVFRFALDDSERG